MSADTNYKYKSILKQPTKKKPSMKRKTNNSSLRHVRFISKNTSKNKLHNKFQILNNIEVLKSAMNGLNNLDKEAILRLIDPKIKEKNVFPSFKPKPEIKNINSYNRSKGSIVKLKNENVSIEEALKERISTNSYILSDKFKNSKRNFYKNKGLDKDSKGLHEAILKYNSGEYNKNDLFNDEFVQKKLDELLKKIEDDNFLTIRGSKEISEVKTSYLKSYKNKVFNAWFEKSEQIKIKIDERQQFISQIDKEINKVSALKETYEKYIYGYIDKGYFDKVFIDHFYGKSIRTKKNKMKKEQEREKRQVYGQKKEKNNKIPQ